MSTHQDRVADQQDDQAAEEQEEVNGIPGQIIYPDPVVDAERAAAYAGGKEEFLYEADEDADTPQTAWTNPADNTQTEEQVENNETEPAELRGGEGDSTRE